MNDTFSQHPGTILEEDRLGLFTRSPFLPVHFYWTTTQCGEVGPSGESTSFHRRLLTKDLTPLSGHDGFLESLSDAHSCRAVEAKQSRDVYGGIAQCEYPPFPPLDSPPYAVLLQKSKEMVHLSLWLLFTDTERIMPILN